RVRRTGAAPYGRQERLVVALPALPDTAQHQASAAHVAAADEIRLEDQTRAEDLSQNVHVLPARDRSQQHDLTILRRRLGERSRGAREGPAVARLGDFDWDPSEPFQVRERDRLVRWQEPGVRRDDEDPGGARRRTRKLPRVSELAAEI